MKPRGIMSWLLRRVGALLLAGLGTLAVFLILPVMQTIGQGRANDLELRTVDVANLPPPPPPPIEQEPEQEEEPEEPPPELLEEAPPLDLAQLELALDLSAGDEAVGDFAVKLVGDVEAGGSEELDKIFSLSELDQRPRVIFQRPPTYPAELRKRKRQGTVYVVFQVDTRGHVSNVKVQRATDPAFQDAALEAVRQWRFEPGTRNGEKVSFKMLIPITFNAT